MPQTATTLQQAVIANALRVYNAGAIGGLRIAGEYIAEYYQQWLQTNYSQKGTGRPYKHPDIGVTRASLPGQPPAKQTGDLRDSVRRAVTRNPGRNPVNGQFVKGFGKVDIKIYTNHPNAAELEYGTSKIAPRPNWTTARRSKLIMSVIKSNTKARFVGAERAAARARMTGVPVTTFGREALRRG